MICSMERLRAGPRPSSGVVVSRPSDDPPSLEAVGQKLGSMVVKAIYVAGLFTHLGMWILGSGLWVVGR